MFNRTAPRALALSFAIVVVFALAVVAIFAIPTPSAPNNTVARIATCAEFANGDYPADTVGGVCYLPGQDDSRGYPALDTADYGTDIPRCASDDWNSDHAARCYTQRVTDGAVLVIDSTDTVIATIK